MAHSNRQRRKELRLAAKKARKAAWVAKIGLSRNKKNKGNTSAGRQAPKGKVLATVPVEKNGVLVKALRMVHRGAKCFNMGCKKCSPYWEAKLKTI